MRKKGVLIIWLVIALAGCQTTVAEIVEDAQPTYKPLPVGKEIVPVSLPTGVVIEALPTIPIAEPLEIGDHCTVDSGKDTVWLYPDIVHVENERNKMIRNGWDCEVLGFVDDVDLSWDAYGPLDFIWVECNNFRGFIFEDWCE